MGFSQHREMPSFPRIVSPPHPYVNRPGFSIHLAARPKSVFSLLAPLVDVTFFGTSPDFRASFRVSMWVERTEGSIASQSMGDIAGEGRREAGRGQG